MTQKQLSNSDTLLRLDTWMALHQRLCYLILAALALGLFALLGLGGLVPQQYTTPCLFAIMMGLLFLYRWMAGAPMRSLRKWAARLDKANESQNRDMLAYAQALEKALPDSARRQLNYQITTLKAALLSNLGQKEEALALLKGFDQIWDESQRTGIQKMIGMISGEGNDAAQKEN